MELKSAKKILSQITRFAEYDLDDDTNAISPSEALKAMHAYAKQIVQYTLQEAAEKAEMKETQTLIGFIESGCGMANEIDRSSILNLETEILNKIK